MSVQRTLHDLRRLDFQNPRIFFSINRDSIYRNVFLKTKQQCVHPVSMSGIVGMKRESEIENHMETTSKKPKLPDPKLRILFIYSNNDNEFVKYMWDMEDDQETNSFVYNRFMELYKPGKKIDFGNIDQEEFVGLVSSGQDPEKDDGNNEVSEIDQIREFREYFDCHRKEKFKFGRAGHGVDQLGDVTFMMCYRNV